MKLNELTWAIVDEDGAVAINRYGQRMLGYWDEDACRDDHSEDLKFFEAFNPKHSRTLRNRMIVLVKLVEVKEGEG